MLLGSALLAVALLACAPVAPDAPDETSAAPAPLVLADDPTPTPEPPEEPTTEPTAEPPDQTKPPLPTEEPRPTREPRPQETRPAPTQEPEHPDRLKGCRDVVLFDGDPTAITHQEWCMEQLIDHVEQECSTQPADTQRQCGENIVQEYRGHLFRYGVAKCMGISGDAEDCFIQSSEDFDKAQTNLFKAWNKVRTTGNQEPKVVQAWAATIVCLADEGFRNVNQDILFPWQNFDLPEEYLAKEDALTDDDKELRETIVGPSQDCAKQERLFAAQDAAWTAELQRLNEAEPELVADLIREGLLEELEKPGVTIFLSGEFSNQDDAS